MGGCYSTQYVVQNEFHDVSAVVLRRTRVPDPEISMTNTAVRRDSPSEAEIAQIIWFTQLESQHASRCRDFCNNYLNLASETSKTETESPGKILETNGEIV